MKNKTLSEYYLLVALLNMGHSVVSATYVLFLLEQGLNLFQVNLVNVVFHVTLFALEVPTGIFADVFGRKTSFVASCLIGSGGMLVYAFSGNFLGFIIAEAILAVSQTLYSGAFDSWFIDKAKHHRCKISRDQMFARATQISCVIGAIVAVAGSYLASLSIILPWCLGAVMFLSAGVLAVFFKEEYFVKQKFSVKEGLASVKETVATSAKYCTKNRNFRFLILMAIFMSFALQPMNMYWQPFFKDLTSRHLSVGFVYAGIQLSLFVGSWLAPKILKKFPLHRKILLASLLVMGVSIVLSATSQIVVLSVMFFFLHEVARGVVRPVRNTYLHNNIPSKQRATIGSVDSLIAHVGSTLGLLASGVIAEKFGINFTWIVFGGFLIISTVMLFRNGNHDTEGL